MGTLAPAQHHHVRASVVSVTRSADGTRRYVEGIAYPALDPEQYGDAIPAAEAELRIDSYVTWMRRAALERFAHQFLRHARAIDSAHDHGEVGTLVESYLTREGHPTYPADVWVARVEVTDPGAIEKLDAGELRGFSIEFVSPIAVKDLKIAQSADGKPVKVRTGEITDPLPLYLSLVKNPSIGIPFSVVESRASGAQGGAQGPREFSQTRADAEAEPGLRVVSAPAETSGVTDGQSGASPGTLGTHGEQPKMDTSETQARADESATTAQTPPTAPTTEPAGTVTPAAPAPVAASEPVTQLRSVRDAITPERREVLDDIARRSDAPYDLAACWVECKDSLTMWDGFSNALYLYENVYWNIRYCSEPEGVQAAMIEKAAADFAKIVSGIARAFPGYVATAAADEAAEAAAAIAADIATDGAELAAVQGRAQAAQTAQGMQTRAGKVLSAANREKVQSARDACAAGMGHLDELLAIGAAVETAEGEAGGEARSAQPAAPAAPTPPATATTPTAAPDLIAALEQRLAAVEARTSLDAAALAQARADLDAANARSAEITKARDEATAARDAARSRVAELEGMRPAARATVDEHEAVLTGALDKGTLSTQGTHSDRRSVWAGTLFPAGSPE